jgi:surfeit locus 1 family protein
VEQFFTRRWILTTLLVLAACGVMVRLGIWQLDRLEQRRAFNSRVAAQQAAPTLELAGSGLESDLPEMEYRGVTLTGEYLHEDQIALRNRVWGNQPGVHLVTPLRISGTDRAILVDRGWIPAEAMDPAAWPAYDEAGVVTVQGVIRRSTTRPDLGSRDDPIRAPGEEPLKVWNLLNVERIDQQVSAELLPVYVQQAPDPVQAGPPYRSLPDLELTDGPHLGYAGQWFLFALILGIGYPFYLRRQSRDAQQADKPYVSSESISN